MSRLACAFVCLTTVASPAYALECEFIDKFALFKNFKLLVDKALVQRSKLGGGGSLETLVLDDCNVNSRSVACLGLSDNLGRTAAIHAVHIHPNENTALVAQVPIGILAKSNNVGASFKYSFLKDEDVNCSGW